MSRKTYAKQALGTEMSKCIASSRVLMVGAGGIGCELLKNLALMEFGEIHVVDLDTIDLSNLNRQFLFRKEHIQKPKAHVAKEAALKFNPKVNIISYHANIKDKQFSRSWFKSFDIVFNALDNIDARKYVNKMCISVDIPLIESGTTGFHGQAFIIKKGITACYECEYLETPKTFPVCTIRNTPSQPIHCIVWAKSYLFTEIFGDGAEGASELSFEKTGENAEELEKLRSEMLALQKIRETIDKPEFLELIFNKVFNDDIRTSLAMEDMWKGRKKPVPMHYKDFHVETDSNIAKNDQNVWTKEQCVQVFNDSVGRLSKRILESKGKVDSIIEFDKDDPDTLDFVAATATLRCHIFGLEPKSKFDIKQMAGNIIPAIATTNAIIAGACVLQAFKVFQEEFLSPGSFITSKSSYRLMSSFQRPPNKECLVCGSAQTDAFIHKDTKLGDIVDALKSTLNYKNFEVYSSKGLIYEKEEEEKEDDDDDDDDNETTDLTSKTLIDLNIEEGSALRVLEPPRVELILHLEASNDGNQVIKISNIDIPIKEKSSSDGNTNGDANGGAVQPFETQSNSDVSLKRSAIEDLEGPVKSKLKIDDNQNGPIVID